MKRAPTLNLDSGRPFPSTDTPMPSPLKAILMKQNTCHVAPKKRFAVEQNKKQAKKLNIKQIISSIQQFTGQSIPSYFAASTSLSVSFALYPKKTGPVMTT